MKIQTKAPNFALTKGLNENTDRSTKFWLKVWQDWALAREYMMLTLRSIQFFHANNKQVRRLVQFWQNFQTSLVLLIPLIVLAIARLPILIKVQLR
jgi:hypothetical protein